jgi:hypothetical protein
LDAAERGDVFSITQQQEMDLAQSFSRGFSHGFLSGVNHQELVQGRFPKSRGVRIGNVVEVTQRGIVVELEKTSCPLSPWERGFLAGGEEPPRDVRLANRSNSRRSSPSTSRSNPVTASSSTKVTPSRTSKAGECFP